VPALFPTYTSLIGGKVIPSKDLEPHEAAEPVDEMTKASLAEAEEFFRKGESISLEHSQTNARERNQVWKKSYEPEKIAA